MKRKLWIIINIIIGILLYIPILIYNFIYLVSFGNYKNIRRVRYFYKNYNHIDKFDRNLLYVSHILFSIIQSLWYILTYWTQLILYMDRVIKYIDKIYWYGFYLVINNIIRFSIEISNEAYDKFILSATSD